MKRAPHARIFVIASILLGLAGCLITGCGGEAQRRKAINQRVHQLVDRRNNNPKDEEALHEVVAILNSDWSFGRVQACGGLRDMGANAQPAIPDLIKALNCGDGFVEREAARALGKVGVESRDAMEALRKRLNENSEVAWFSAESLGSIGCVAREAIPDLEKAAGGPYKFLARDAQKALKSIRERKCD